MTEPFNLKLPARIRKQAALYGLERGVPKVEGARAEIDGRVLVPHARSELSQE